MPDSGSANSQAVVPRSHGRDNALRPGLHRRGEGKRISTLFSAGIVEDVEVNELREGDPKVWLDALPLHTSPHLLGSWTSSSYRGLGFSALQENWSGSNSGTVTVDPDSPDI